MRTVYYYLGKDNKVYTGRDIALAAKLVHNMNLKNKEDLDQYINLRCAGILKELESVSVEELVKMNETVKAIALYKELHDCTLREASEYVTALEESYKNKNK